MKPGFFKTNRRGKSRLGCYSAAGRWQVRPKLHPSLVLVVSAALGLAWHIYATEAKPTDQQGQRPYGMPKWSFTAAIALPDGSLEILH